MFYNSSQSLTIRQLTRWRVESIRLKVEAGEMIINTRMVPASNL